MAVKVCTKCGFEKDEESFGHTTSHGRRVRRAYCKVCQLESYKARPCTDCGQTFPSCVMDFDHIADNKVCDVARLAQSTYSLEVLKREVAKCELVCANCHRIRTWKRGTYRKREAA